jgi:predicted SnoaL-like aldol condensation-catalyzing enzyme
MWTLVISEYGRAWGGSEMEGKPHSEEIMFDSLSDVRAWFEIMSDRDPDARPHIVAKLKQGNRVMFDIHRTKNQRSYWFEFAPVKSNA